jgi:hypothetical protein
MQKKAKKKEKELRVEYVKCPDCSTEYDSKAPHEMFCSAKMCSTCHTTFGYVLPVTGTDDDGNEERTCEECMDDDEEEEE